MPRAAFRTPKRLRTAALVGLVAVLVAAGAAVGRPGGSVKKDAPPASDRPAAERPDAPPASDRPAEERPDAPPASDRPAAERTDPTADGERGSPSPAAERTPGWDGFRGGEPALSVDRLVITLVFVLGGAAAAVWALRRFGPGRLFPASVRGEKVRMQLLGRLPLGGKRGLVMVRAAGRLLVLGVSEAGVQKVLDRADDGGEPEGFADLLGEVPAPEDAR